MGFLFNLDLNLFGLINGFAGRWEFLDYLGIFFASYFEYFLWLFLAIFIVLDLKNRWRVLIVALIAAAFSRFVLGELIRYLWFRPRPFVALNFLPLINQSPAEASFPSGHALLYFALATVAYKANKKLGPLFFCGAFLIIVSRVFTGVHWPSDVLAGALIGILVGILGNFVLNKIKK
jgi:undecaprenyl-diphosphatase